MTEQTPAPVKRGFGYAALIGVALLGAVSGGFVSNAIGHGMGSGGPGWGHHGMHGPMNLAEAQEHAEHMVDHVAWAIDATPEQKQKLTVIAAGIAKDLFPIHEKMHAATTRAVELLRQPKTDRAALETLRAEQIATADEASKRLTQGFADAADVLTPQQRTKLAQHWSF